MFDNKGGNSASKTCGTVAKVAIGMCIVLTCVFIVLGAIAAIAVLAPRSPELNGVKLNVTRLSMEAYCPSPTNTSCCTFPDCSLTIPNVLDTVIEFQATMQVVNKNIGGPISWARLTVNLKRGDTVVGTAQETEGSQPAQSSDPKTYTIQYAMKLPNAQTILKAILCDLDAAETATRSTPLNAEFVFTDVKYIGSVVQFPLLTIKAAVDFAAVCETQPDKCRINTLYRGVICN